MKVFTQNGEVCPQEVIWFLASFRRRLYFRGSTCGIYVLRDEEFDPACPLYVGQSENVPSRVSQHSLGRPRGTNKIRFTHYDFCECEPEDLLLLERVAIDNLRPLLNKTFGGLSRMRYGMRNLDESYLDKLYLYMIHSGLQLSFLPRERAKEMVAHITRTAKNSKEILCKLGYESHPGI